MKTPPPILSISMGRIGITIPNPSKSIKTTKSKIIVLRSGIKIIVSINRMEVQ